MDANPRSLLRGLRNAGFSSELTYRGFHSLDVYILGFTLGELNLHFDHEEVGEQARAFLAELPADEFPYLIEHVEQHLADPDHEEEFAFGLDLILDGLERTRDQA